ncbi:MAG: diaminopimelate epimerase [Selenomonas sp.]|uniref:diaminopimelate epimerase n=1 Tax=Selenomonas sp. TaxID=2053611 RepID=UPI0025D4486B|nr:diaminopimelate epimerase [Selenomonas sp.]MCI6086073.1 diaminopimelate epimerase [Selenomonas sp.]
MNFTKWQGCGNDFVLIDCRAQELADYGAFAQKACDRHYGIGGDGILVVLPSDKADFRMRIFNTDGSEAEMCGNGIRCFARYLYDNGITKKRKFTVETGAGILVPEIIEADGTVTGVRVDMGEPVLAADQIPMKGYGANRVVNEPVEVAGRSWRITGVSMGNPHCVVFVDDIKTTPIEEVGPVFETQERYPKKTNTEFVQVLDRQHMRMRVWERGAAITLACGTGACATLTAAVLNDLTDRKAEIQLDGGTLTIEWDERDNHLYMTGPAVQTFAGTVEA